MTEILKICAAALVVGVAAFLLREMGWRGAIAFSIFGTVALLSFLSDGLFTFVGSIKSLSETAGTSDMAKEILKIIGASYVFGISSDICLELGERALSSALTAVGKVEILLVTLPYFIKILEAATSLVSE